MRRKAKLDRSEKSCQLCEWEWVSAERRSASQSAPSPNDESGAHSLVELTIRRIAPRVGRTLVRDLNDNRGPVRLGQRVWWSGDVSGYQRNVEAHSTCRARAAGYCSSALAHASLALGAPLTILCSRKLLNLVQHSVRLELR